MKNNYLKVFTLRHQLKKCFGKEGAIALILMASSLNAMAQVGPEKAPVEKINLNNAYEVKGTVFDDEGQPLPNATVLVKGTNLAVQTDNYGDFMIRVPQGYDVIMISYIGMNYQEITVKNRNNIKVSLKKADNQLKEIVVVAYGQQQKKDVVTAVSTIKAEEIMQENQLNIGNALQGKVNGAVIVSGSGTPGKNKPTIMIRNNNPKYTPLVVVDGVPRYTDNNTSPAGNIALNGITLDDLNPDEIESISVLKDNAATALYGTRGAYGVLMITTKRGKIGKPKFSLNSNYAVTEPARFPKMLGGYQYALAQNEIDLNNGKAADKVSFLPDALEMIKNNTDPYVYSNQSMYDKLVQRNASQQSHSLSVSGGNELVRYYINGSAGFEKGIIKAYDYNRYTIQSNLDFKLTNDLQLGFNSSYRNSNIGGANSSSETIFGGIFSNSPLTPIYNRDGSLNANTSGGDNRWANTITDLSGYQQNKSNNVSAAANLEYSPSFIPGLKLRLNNSINFNSAEYKEYKRSYATYVPDATSPTGYKQIGGTAPNTLRNNLGTATFYNTDFGFDYSKTIKKHRFGVLVLGTNYYATTNSTQVFRDGIISGLETISQGRSLNQTINGTDSESGKLGGVLRTNYDFDNKYAMEFSLRADASVNFPEEHRWGYFPGGAVAWRLSEENFIKDNVPFIQELKIRASIGLTGIDNLTAYNYLYAYNLATTALNGGGGYSFNGTYQPSFILDTRNIPNPDVTWGKSMMRNIGVDFTLWKGLLSGTFDIYDKDLYDLARDKQASYPATLGIGAPLFNFAKEYYSGFESSLTNNLKFGNDMSLTTTFNLTYNHSRVVDYGEPENTLPYNKKEGYSIQSGKFYRAIGIFQNQDEITNYNVLQDNSNNSTIKPGDIKYEDISGPNGTPDGKIDAYDQVIYNNVTTPPFSGGLNLTFRYKSFSVNAYVQGAGGNLISFVPSNYSQYGYDNAWRPDNTGAIYPRLSTASNNSNSARPNTLYLNKGDYARFKNLKVAYTVPGKLLKKTGLTNMTISVAAVNLWSISGIKDIDPELLNSNGGYYPTMRNYSVGLSVGL